MTTTRRPLRRASRGALSSGQEQCLWLGVGYQDDPFPFEDEDACHEAWERHGSRVMASHAGHGRRPAGWWAYDAPEWLEFDFDRERSTLYEAGLLEGEEAAALVESWKLEFQKAHAPDFTYCGGPGRVSPRPRGGAGASRMGRRARDRSSRSGPGAQRSGRSPSPVRP